MNKKWKKFAAKKSWYNFDQKLQFSYPQASIKDVQAIGEAFSPQRRIQHFKHKISWPLSIFVGNFCPSGFGSGFTELTESGSETLLAYVFTLKWSWIRIRMKLMRIRNIGFFIMEVIFNRIFAGLSLDQQGRSLVSSPPRWWRFSTCGRHWNLPALR
jgi:hypothetical protein